MPNKTIKKKKKNAWNSILGKSSSKTPLQGFKTSIQGLKTPLQDSLNPVWGLIKFFPKKTPLQDFKTSLQGLKTPLQGTLNINHTYKKFCKKTPLQDFKNVTIGLKNATIRLPEYGAITLINFSLHGTRFPESRVPCKFFLFLKFDRV